MFQRVLLLVALAGLVTIVSAAIRAWLARRAANLRREPAAAVWSALGQAPDGRPGLVVFSAPLCVACRTAQHPAVEVVQAEYRDALRVVHVDIAHRPEAARAFSILTAPSTAVLGPNGSVSAVNQGFASAARLRAQLSAAGASPA
ncbi:MAG TPA: thioredoxin family protein [Candidatus Dormibacteraeota bacterium]